MRFQPVEADPALVNRLADDNARHAARSSSSMSSHEPMPPLAVSSIRGKRSSSFRYRSTDGPDSMPSLAMSVQITCRRPLSANRPISSSTPIAEASCQPLTATRPSRVSAPSTIRSGPNSVSHCRSRSGRATAMLPQIAREAPEPNTSRSASVLLMPPPYCTSSEVRAVIRSSTPRLAGREAFAPSRSTMCRRPAPHSSYRRAASSGSL